jgi:hypothetical protein
MMYFWPKRNMRTTGRAESRAPAEKVFRLRGEIGIHMLMLVSIIENWNRG